MRTNTEPDPSKKLSVTEATETQKKSTVLPSVFPVHHAKETQDIRKNKNERSSEDGLP